MNKKKHILFLTVNYPPNPTVGTKRVSKILKYLDYDKYDVSVLTLKEKYYDTVQGQKSGDMQKIPAGIHVYRTDIRELTSFFTYLKAKIKRLLKNEQKNITKGENPGLKRNQPQKKKSDFLDVFFSKTRRFIFSFLEFPDKYIGWFGKAVKKGVQIVKKENIDIIFTTAPPHSIFIIAAVIKQRTGAKLILDFRDPWALASWVDTTGIERFMKRRLENYVVKKADMLIFVTEKLKEIYRNEYSEEATEKFQFFSNGYDPDDFPTYLNISKSRTTANIRMVHLGTLYKKRDPMPFIQAIKELQEEDKLGNISLSVDFIGTLTPRYADLPMTIKALSLDGIIHFLPNVSFKQSILTMYESDVLLLIQPDTLMQIPAKLFEYMYTKKPIFAITEPNSAIEKIISEGRLGVTAPSKNIQAIKDKILMMFEYIHSDRQTADDYIEQFNIAKSITTFERFIDSIG